MADKEERYQEINEEEKNVFAGMITCKAKGKQRE